MKAKISKKHKRRGVEASEQITVECSISQLSYIDALIETSNLTKKQIIDVERKTHVDMTEGEAQEMITFLLENQLCPIESGRNYSQGDIIKKLKELK